jgi:hypothetical protein
MNKIKEFSVHLKQLREDFDSVWSKTEEAMSPLFEDEFPVPRKRIRIGIVSGEDRKSSYRRLFSK